MNKYDEDDVVDILVDGMVVGRGTISTVYDDGVNMPCYGILVEGVYHVIREENLSLVKKASPKPKDDNSDWRKQFDTWRSNNDV